MGRTGKVNEDLHEELAAHPLHLRDHALGELRALCDALGLRERANERIAISIRDIRVARRMTALCRFLDRPVRVFALRTGARGPSSPGNGSVVRLTWNVPSAVRADASRVARRVAFHEGYLAGALLTSGYLADPIRGYSLELSPSRTGEARVTAGLRRSLKRLGIPYGEARGRRGGVRLYVKGGEAVSAVLRHVGAVESLFHLEDARSMRAVRGRVHRAVNAETANLTRAVRAGVQQAALARRVLAEGRLAELPPAVREVAQLRVCMPEASLTELGERLGIARSSVHGRLRRLEAWARAVNLGPAVQGEGGSGGGGEHAKAGSAGAHLGDTRQMGTL